jgi:hypothetical protein
MVFSMVHSHSSSHRAKLTFLPDEPLPGYHRFWDMLIKRCPNLEHLAIDGHSPHAPVDAHGLVHGRWPKLRSLLIGDVVFDWHVGTLERPFRSFLNAHLNLEALHLHSHAPSVAAPGVLSDLHADALAKVSTFSGSLVQAQALPARTSLKTLRIPDAMLLREGTPLSVGVSLAALPSLSSLTIAFRLEQGYDNGSILRAIVASCPRLHHLDITVSYRHSFTIVSPYPLHFSLTHSLTHSLKQETFSRSIRPLTQLRTLILRIVPSPTEDSLRKSGARLVRSSPRLSSFHIIFLTPRTESVVRSARRASFVLAADSHGLPLALHVVERRARLLWMGEAVRRATLEMRPAGAPGTRRAPLRALVLERSPAGEETRLLLLCAVLLAVVVWGCITL